MRWDGLKAENREDQGQLGLPGMENAGTTIRTFDAPEALGTRFHEIRAKSALNRVPAKSRMPFKWTVNSFRGCSHSCVFCFARPTHTYLGFDAGRDFEREIVVKVNVPELLAAELRKPTWARELVAFGTNTDPYQWAEGRYRLMPPMLDALAEARTPLSILTKSPLVLRDADRLEEIAAAGLDVSVNFSIPTLEEKAWRATEPHTPHPRKRIEAVAEMNSRGIASGVLIAPLMPGINDRPGQIKEIVRLCEEAGASFIGGIGLHLRPGVREVFMDWLRHSRPDLVPRYEELYRGKSYLPAPVRWRIVEPLEARGPVRRSRFGDAFLAS